ncbi:predicted protein [Naegleria gruberi]|uniref:Predicted protein n=1 Tax=Naegleria gruberi TaxID=5762 RepID=D2W1U3_NAEGR|nr:uncharacterized protein NAEGRDRAFT_76053 [Naegleria gruberi]XP_002669771.1 uncharacterized protein NAEGRDRAFT_75380 [Naegleria gruberi]EFC36290.1 predicted protein [Naegleria gruberi]EFC37027.1 predicted protein [Naegleria gruberi]|eukprot:XP_002669034.1 predicted protein [Naegleria gruberi strain NEG-M]
MQALIPFDRSAKQFTSEFPSQFSSILAPETFDSHLEQINKCAIKHVGPITIQTISVSTLVTINSLALMAAVSGFSTLKKYDTSQPILVGSLLAIGISLLLIAHSIALILMSIKYKQELRSVLQRLSQESDVTYVLENSWFSQKIRMEGNQYSAHEV